MPTEAPTEAPTEGLTEGQQRTLTAVNAVAMSNALGGPAVGCMVGAAMLASNAYAPIVEALKNFKGRNFGTTEETTEVLENSVRTMQALQLEFVHATNTAHPTNDTPGNAREMRTQRVTHIEESYRDLLAKIKNDMLDEAIAEATMLDNVMDRVRSLTRVDEVEGMRVMASGEARSWRHTDESYAEGRKKMEAAAGKIVAAYEEMVKLQQEMKAYWNYQWETHERLQVPIWQVKALAKGEVGGTVPDTVLQPPLVLGRRAGSQV